MKICTKKNICPGAAQGQPVMVVFRVIKAERASENGRKRIELF
jgi:hypothetical protein